MIEIKPHLKILMLEDNPFDVVLMQEMLQNEISQPEFYCASDREGYLKALDIFAPDIILSDNSFPQFTAAEALGILRKRSDDTPFILVTGSVSKELAIDIVEQGANGYIPKDMMATLPVTIEAVLKQQHVAKDTVDYQCALDQAAIIAIIDRQGFITYVNENCCNISGYHAAELIGNNQDILFAGGYQSHLWSTIQRGAIWQGEFLNQAKNGNSYWLHSIIVPLDNEKDGPCRYLAISNDITAKKKQEAALQLTPHSEELKMTAIALAAQEKERNSIGQELHDNVNQLLVATKMVLSSMIERTGGDDELLRLCSKNIFNAIEENRKIAGVLVSPDLETETLAGQLKKLSESMLTIIGLQAHIDTGFFNEGLLSAQQKLALYRISQEQCTNIVKHAFAKNVFIILQTAGAMLKMIIADDGRGIKDIGETKGIGLKNIADRIGIFNGTVRAISSPGSGFTLEIEFPLNNQILSPVRKK